MLGNTKFRVTAFSPIKLFTVLDALIIAVVLAGAALIFPLVFDKSADSVSIVRDNVTIATYPLSEDRTISVKGNIGPMKFEIKNKSIRVTASSCPKHICLYAGAIHQSGQQIICSPNHILVEIISSQKDGLDAVSQ